jgi:hypothetical protein
LDRSRTFSCGQWPAYHTPADTVDGVDLEKLQRLAAALGKVLRRADQATLGPAEAHDTTGVELRALHRYMGPAAMAAAAVLIGVDRISTRDDLDRVVPALQEMAYYGGAH